MNKPLVSIIMGSDSDWEVMQQAAIPLQQFGIPYEADIVSAHRTPDKMFTYARTAHERGIRGLLQEQVAPLIYPAWWRPSPRYL